MSEVGKCDECQASFEYELWHMGFSDSAYAYCEKCGCIATINAWTAPPNTKIKFQQAIPEAAEHELEACTCGGRFRRNASPRCPKCEHPIDAQKAASWINANAPGFVLGWGWQKSWTGLYGFCVEKRFVQDPWVKGTS